MGTKLDVFTARKARFALVQRLIELGPSVRISLDDGEVVGIDSKGIEVSIGNIWDDEEAARTLKYLESYPTPDTW